LGEIVTGKTPSTKDASLWGGELLFITPTDISEDCKYQHGTQRTVVATTSTRTLPIGSIVYTCIASIGKIAMTARASITNQQINSVIPKRDANNEFLFYSLVNLTPWIKSIPSSSTLPIINKSEFSKIGVNIPPTPAEQQKIADCLGSLDGLIAAEGRKLAALRDHKGGLMQQLFPQPGQTQPRLRFPEFRDQGEWREKRLGQLGHLIPGLTYSPKDVRDNGLLVLRSSNIQNGKITLDDCVYVRPSVKGAKFARPNDILICVRNGSKPLIGKNAIIPPGMPKCTHGRS
jgi:type I restriction enzyme S subunit